MAYMQIVVFGANGKVGSLVVEKLLNDGHFVRAFVHSGSQLPKHKNLQILKGDVKDVESVNNALDGANAVISALGSWGTPTKDIVSTGIRSIILAMQAHNITRVISLTGSGARDLYDKPSLLDRMSCWAIRIAARKIVDDGESHIAQLRKTKLAWTVIRSPLMKNSSRQRSFILSKKSPPPWAAIVRDDVASAMVELVTNNEWRQAAPYIRQP